MTLIRIDNIANLHILYDRDPASNYGLTGFAVRPYIDDNFSMDVTQAFQHLTQSLVQNGVGQPTSILFGGIARSGNGSSYHHKNRAFDFDGLVFADAENWVANSFPIHPFIYLGIEAVLRQHFGTVLSYDYNADHQDHFHFDNGTRPGFQRFSKSRVLFLQNAMRYLFDFPVGIDGVYGPETSGAEKRIRSELGLGGFSEPDNWMAFLSLCETTGFQRHANTNAPAVAAQ